MKIKFGKLEVEISEYQLFMIVALLLMACGIFGSLAETYMKTR